MQSRLPSFPFSPNFNFGNNGLFFGKNDDQGNNFPPIEGNFELLDGSPFLLLDGTDFLLL